MLIPSSQGSGRNARACGHFLTEQALKCLYLAIMSRTRPGRAASAGPTAGKPPLRAFDITFDGPCRAQTRTLALSWRFRCS
jgi:putative transposase